LRRIFAAFSTGSITKKLIDLLKQRIDDEPFLRLIRKWLKAGILETDGRVIHPQTGSPQGGIVSPMLANIYLHDALDVWFEETVKVSCKGKAYLCLKRRGHGRRGAEVGAT